MNSLLSTSSNSCKFCRTIRKSLLFVSQTDKTVSSSTQQRFQHVPGYSTPWNFCYDDSPMPHQPRKSQAAARLWDHYKKAKNAQEQVSMAGAVNRKAIFCNNELDLSNITAWGFDYDYTLSTYRTRLNSLIYWKALQRLVDSGKYPGALLDTPYDPKFVVRGLHYDVYRSVLLKLDAYRQIQMDTVYRGKTRLNEAEVWGLYNGDTVPWNYLEPDRTGVPPMFHLTDLFSLPQAGLLATIVDYFMTESLEYDNLTLFKDVERAVRDVHWSGDMYSVVENDLEKYLHKNVGLSEFLERLHKAKKTMFLITNSLYEFTDKGMKYMIGDGWRDYFDCIIVRAQKPAFFKDPGIPFREYFVAQRSLNWQRVTSLKKGNVYAEGNIYDFARMTGLRGKGILFLGDHIYSDLRDPTLKMGWNTGAIVAELETEIKNHESREYLRMVQWYQILTTLIEFHQDEARSTSETKEILDMWIKEKDQCKSKLKSLFNPQFGSIFRSYHNPSFFMRRLSRLADVYTSKLPNFLNYSLDHCFYPRRSPLPHENFFSIVPDKLGLIDVETRARIEAQADNNNSQNVCKYRGICAFGGNSSGDIIY